MLVLTVNTGCISSSFGSRLGCLDSFFFGGVQYFNDLLLGRFGWYLA